MPIYTLKTSKTRRLLSTAVYLHVFAFIALLGIREAKLDLTGCLPLLTLHILPASLLIREAKLAFMWSRMLSLDDSSTAKAYQRNRFVWKV